MPERRRVAAWAAETSSNSLESTVPAVSEISLAKLCMAPPVLSFATLAADFAVLPACSFSGSICAFQSTDCSFSEAAFAAFSACALSGGEDYELLFTIKQEDHEKLVLNEEISVIGYMTEAEKGAHIFTKGGNKFPITAQGWNAFAGK